MSNNVNVYALSITENKEFEHEIRVEFKTDKVMSMQELAGKAIGHARDVILVPNGTYGEFTAKVLEYILKNTQPTSVTISNVEFAKWNVTDRWYPILSWDDLSVGVATKDNEPVWVSFYIWQQDDEDFLDECIQSASHASNCMCNECLERTRDDNIDNEIDERRIDYGKEME
jgi:hypothetical protein